MLKNIDLKKDRKPDPIQSLIKKPLDPPIKQAVPTDFSSKLSQSKKVPDQLKVENMPEERKLDEKSANDNKKTHDFSKKNNEGWEDEDLQIGLNEIESFEKEKRTEKGKEEAEEKKSNIFSKLFEVKSYVATKAKEEKPTIGIQNSSKTTYF